MPMAIHGEEYRYEVFCSFWCNLTNDNGEYNLFYGVRVVRCIGKSCIAAKVVKYAAMHYVFEDLSRDRGLWFVICSLVSFVFFLIEELYLNLTL
jgi:hypothetical protein